MNIRDLEYFQRLALEKNYSKVADFYHVSQPTITYAVKRLETELNVSLVNRNQAHKNITLTPAGRQFLLHVNSILRELRIAKQEMTHFTAKKLPLGLPPIIGNYYFPKLSPKLLQADILPHLIIQREGSENLLRQIKLGRLDVGLIGSLDAIHEDFLNTEILTKKKFKIVAAPTHPLATKKTVAFADLGDEKFLLLSEQYVHHHAFARLSQSSNTDPKIIYQSDDLDILKGMIKSGMGIGFLAELAVSPDDNLVTIDLSDLTQPQFLISLIHRNSSIVTPIMEELLALIRQVVTEDENKKVQKD
ncbi:LysR family transcriptional regulator [Enterococcus sp. SMC-9]|uniref:LysR family transcriptional regulator n=1 Tax=Enterococcus sp. SMC-9 TaxID=2862343 RepID=UPI001E2A21CE|nr:LysR family transcriptional regulator [Enterococcus sp. SMC-9]MCD1024688.1 LysR family transcriptional regulator [Enterococcus sp. SMC-9]